MTQLTAEQSELSTALDSSVEKAPEVAVTEEQVDSQPASRPLANWRLTRCPHPLKRPFACIAWLVQAVFGGLSLLLVLAILSALPVINLIGLGFLLDVQGRVGRSGKLSHAFPLLDIAPRIGVICLGFWLMLMPVRLLTDFAADATLLQPGSGKTNFLNGLATLVQVAITIHLCCALARGGSVWCFLRPIKNIRWVISRLRQGEFFSGIATSMKGLYHEFSIPAQFRLGLIGLLGALAWILIPTAMLGTPEASRGLPMVVTVVGGAILAIVLTWLPILQTEFATTGQWRSLLALSKARRLFRQTPAVWTVSYLFIYALSLPLFLFKVVSPPRDAMWLLTIVFIISLYPMKLILGMAYFRAARLMNDEENHQPFFLWRWVWSLASVLLLAFYVFIFFFTQFISEDGTQALFENPVFSLPSPF